MTKYISSTTSRRPDAAAMLHEVPRYKTLSLSGIKEQDQKTSSFSDALSRKNDLSQNNEPVLQNDESVL